MTETTTKKHSLLYKISRITAWVLLTVFTLILLLFGLINLPATQKFLTKKAESYLEETLQTEVRIGRVGWALPKQVFVEDVYMETPAGDSLFTLGRFEVGIGIFGLIKQKVQIDRVYISDVTGDFFVRKDTSNIAFLTEAFAPADSTALQQEVTPVDTTAGTAWEILVSDAVIDLKNIDVRYDDTEVGLFLDLKVGSFEGNMGDANLEKGQFYVDNLDLADADIAYRAYPIETDTTASAPLDYTIGLGTLTGKNVAFSMQQDSINLQTNIGNLAVGTVEARLSGESIGAKVGDFDLTESAIKYDLAGTPRLSGFDPNHLDFSDLTLQARELEYEDLDVEVIVEEISGKTAGDLVLEDLRGAVVFNEQGVSLQNFALKTNRSELAESDVVIAYNFLDTTANLENMGLNLQIPSGTLSPQDVLYFSPELQPYFAKAKGNIDFATTLQGSLADLQIEKFNLTGFGSEVIANGNIQNAMNTDRLALDLRIDKMTSRGPVLRDFLPENTLPAGTQLPEYFDLKGNVSGALAGTLNVDVQAKTTRQNSIGTTIDLNGDLRNVMNDSLAYDLNIDNFISDDVELNAYLPDGILPPGYSVPTRVDLTGTVRGGLNAVTPNLLLKASAPTGNAVVETAGSIVDFNDPRLDFELVQTQIDTAFFAYVLPDSLLPAEIRLPNIESGTADLQGTLANLNALLDVKTSAGNIAANVKSNNEVYDFQASIKELNLLKVTAGSLYDTLARTNLDALNVEITGTGANLDSLEIATANADLVIKEINSKYPGLQGNIKLDPAGVTADIDFNDIAGKADLVAFFDMKNKYRADGKFTNFDFKDIPYVRYPIIMDGNFDADARYDSLSNMTADVLLNAFTFDIEGEDYTLQTMKADVDFMGLKKDVVVRSDWVDADVNGNFDFAEIVTELTNLINDFIQKGNENPVVTESNAVLQATAQWKNTAILTSGIVPGLEEIDPFELKVRFAAAQEDLTAYLNFPKIIYAGNKIENLTGDASTAADILNYQIEIARLQLAGAGNMGDVKLQGGVNDGVFEANLINVDTTGATRLDLTAFAEAEADKYRIRFAEEITLNNDPWRFSPNNEIYYSPENILINDWRLTNGKQALALESVSEEQIRASFEGFKIEELLEAVQMEDLAGGRINGTVTVDNPLGDLRVDADLTVQSTKLYGQKLGDARIDVNNRREISAYDIDFALKGEGNDAEIKGFYDLANPVDAINMNADIKALKLAPFEVFLEDIAHNLHGTLVAQAEITGNATAPSLVGFVRTEDAGITIDQLGAPLDFGPQKIELDGNVIRFENYEIIDSTGNKATLDAFILSEDFTEFEYDLDVTAKNFMVLNTKKEDNELYYGTMIVDATAEVTGDIFSPVVEATASPRKGSDLTYVVPASSTSVDYGEDVVTFVNGLEQDSLEFNPTDTIKSQIAQALNLTVRLNLELNDNLEFTAVIDPVMNNYFTGKGEGFLSFSMFPNGDMEMAGTFTMKEGVYNFVYADFVKRKFDVVAGSSLSWTGDIYNPNLDLKVQYRIKASAYPLVAGQSNVSADKETQLRRAQTFIVQLSITGTLEKTDIATDILYPDEFGNDLDSEIDPALARLQQNQNRMNEQAFGLILFNSFVSEDLSVGANVLNAQGSIGDAITGQLNNIANQYIKFVELDFGLESYDSYDASGNSTNETNLNLTVRKRFFQDRLVISIDGETSSESNDQSSQTQVYLDNLTVEYSLTKNGNWRVKVYNERADQNDFLATDVVKTGAALVISKDFNELRLFGKKKEEK